MEVMPEKNNKWQWWVLFTVIIGTFLGRLDGTIVNLAMPKMMQEMINRFALAKNLDFLGLESGKTPIITIHQAKGLEFDYIFIIGMNEFKFPAYKSDLEEEKRLFYVALTRAKKHIYLSYSNNNMTSFGNRPQTRSRFIEGLNKKFIEVV